MLVLQDFDKAIELDPKYAAPFSNRDLSYADLGPHERAIQDYDVIEAFQKWEKRASWMCKKLSKGVQPWARYQQV